MKTYYPYDPTSPREIIGEFQTIQDGCILLNHIPYKNSIEIAGFVQVDSAYLLPHQFRCDYGDDLYYREANCIVYFNDQHNGEHVVVNYLCVGTIIIAEDLNEIKEHIESDAIHNYYVLPTASTLQKGGIRTGAGLEMVGDILNIKAGSGLEFDANNALNCNVQGGSGGYYTLPTASASQKGGIRPGEGCEMDGDVLNVTVQSGEDAFFEYGGSLFATGILNSQQEWSAELTGDDQQDEFSSPEKAFREQNGRPSKLGDIIEWQNTGMDCGYAYRTADKWINLDYSGQNLFPTTFWSRINPFLTAADREKLDSLQNYSLPTASTETKGGVLIGGGLKMTDDTLSVNHGNGFQIVDGILNLRLGNGLKFDNGVIVPDLGDGLELNEDGKIIYVGKKSSGGWTYQDSGYDVIPAVPLIYVNDTQFYQPELNARQNDMFDTPEGIMEFWIRCDLFLTDEFGAGDRFGFGYHSKTGNYHAEVWNGSFTNSYEGGSYRPGYGAASFTYSSLNSETGLLFNQGANNRILFHAVSHPTEGYQEVTINYGTYRADRNINGGNPFDSFFVYSNSEHALFSNFVVSSTQIPYEDGGN